jgi:hypothetical protein
VHLNPAFAAVIVRPPPHFALRLKHSQLKAS